eukprot:6326729-Prymnesium_polylepis.1
MASRGSARARARARTRIRTRARAALPGICGRLEPHNLKFPRQWARSLGADGCALVDKVFDNEDDDDEYNDMLAVHTDESGELTASGLRL